MCVGHRRFAERTGHAGVPKRTVTQPAAVGQVALVKSAQWLEQAAMATGRYPAVLPDSVWRTPEFNYTLSLSAQAQSYVLTATPSGKKQQDNCGALTLDQVGQRGAQGDVTYCWSK